MSLTKGGKKSPRKLPKKLHKVILIILNCHPEVEILAKSQRSSDANFGQDVADRDYGEAQGLEEQVSEHGGGGALCLVIKGGPAVEDVPGKLLAVVVQDEALDVESQRLVDPRRQHRLRGTIHARVILVVRYFSQLESGFLT